MTRLALTLANNHMVLKFFILLYNIEIGEKL